MSYVSLLLYLAEEQRSKMFDVGADQAYRSVFHGQNKNTVSFQSALHKTEQGGF